MSDLKDRVGFYVSFLEKQIAESEGKSDPNDYIRGLDRGYEGAFRLVAKWLKEALEE